MTDLYRVDCDVWAELEGLGELPITKFEGTWSLNQIPTAQIILPVGRTGDGTEASPAHTIVPQIEALTPIKVYFQARGQFDDDHEWPDEAIVLFEGYVQGPGYDRGDSNVGLSLDLIHWLVDLNFSSSLSSQSHVSNPSDFTRQAIVGTTGNVGISNARPGAIAQSALTEVVSQVNVAEDLWGGAIKPLFCQLANLPHAEIGGELSACVGIEKGDNSQALAALKRIEGVAKLSLVPDATACDLARSSYTPPLSLVGQEIIDPSVVRKIVDAIQGEQTDSFAHSTFWGKLINYSAHFNFAVVPLIEKALVVPFIGGLRELYCKEITVDDYSKGQLRGQLKRPVRAIVLTSQTRTQVGWQYSQTPGHALLGMGGCYSPDDADPKGMIHIRQAPSWLNELDVSGFAASRTTGLKSRKPINTSTTPVADDAEIRDTVDGKNKEAITRSSAQLLNGYAHSLYVDEALRGRAGWISGKLRFDISPGSNVSVEGAGELHLADADKLNQTTIASVVRTTIGIDAQSGKASTGFQLAWLRSEAENQSDRTSVEQHPLYRENFLGAPLSDKLWFAGDGCPSDS